jgi:hypothetical protein
MGTKLLTSTEIILYLLLLTDLVALGLYYFDTRYAIDHLLINLAFNIPLLVSWKIAKILNELTNRDG